MNQSLCACLTKPTLSTTVFWFCLQVFREAAGSLHWVDHLALMEILRKVSLNVWAKTSYVNLLKQQF